MQTHVLDYLTDSVKRVPDKMAYSNGTESLTFGEVYGQSRAIGTFLSDSGVYREPVVIFMNRHPKMVAAFFGVICGGNYYVPIDVEMPESRIRLILENVKAKVMICDAGTMEAAEKMAFDGKIVLYDEICHTGIKEAALQEIYEKALDTDPIYIVFTSGSTGIPKGVTACHRSVIDYIDHLSEALGFDENTVFGNQAPLYMDACLRELFSTVKFGASAYLIPKELFMLPVRLVEFMNEYQINTVCWVVSALTMISALGTFETVIPEHLRLIAFVSEAFPVKQFNKWKAVLPDATYVNLYGPTEGTGVCCYYTVDREFVPGDVIPIGKPFKNTEILLLNEKNQRCGSGEEGEICIRGASLTLGYYNNPEKTAEVFVQNPLNSFYPELIYRTGDIGRLNDRGELEFVSRRDYQIKHMGHRIELGEIEVNVNALDGIEAAGCVYDKARSKIVLYYSGRTDEKTLTVSLKEKLPRYMLPGRIVRLEKLPYTANGKIDRMTLTKML
ncbi:amino acid adenylation domain-containing protein [Acetatifactor muris]|uniref:Tyrocidine synthase 1 n=1 Tax=Acetatifactor muris TaxID=879566 RepID=A0A2K4ZHC5_9FIRM|nr:amino acid adenylation domain-containing protein [Acetatifactor muris]MCI8800066.1 amino acid adenylation domain-containing protein [Lachnospiraceae bacterium]MCR2048070.1 amino acid adenylation domain-containing protein [Acetatifactor muris]SOY29854.1 Tyrocidine synthase 1 [Acetatifactor muris]